MYIIPPMVDRIKYGSLFSGIGGLDLGLDRAGMECVFQVEIDDYCRGILSKNWPSVDRFSDVREFPPEGYSPAVDLLAGGFPCCQVSNARTAQVAVPEGLEGEDSGLWFDMYRIIRAMGPRWVVIENVGSLSTRGLDTVLWQLSECGYDATWQTLSAGAMGAPHLRKRVFVVAVQNTYGEGLERHVCEILAQPRTWRQDAHAAGSDWGDSAPRVCGGADGVPPRLVMARDRLTALGNAVVPAMGEFIGKRIVDADRLLFPDLYSEKRT